MYAYIGTLEFWRPWRFHIFLAIGIDQCYQTNFPFFNIYFVVHALPSRNEDHEYENLSTYSFLKKLYNALSAI